MTQYNVVITAENNTQITYDVPAIELESLHQAMGRQFGCITVRTERGERWTVPISRIYSITATPLEDA